VANKLELIRGGDINWFRHPLAFLVEAADDICYSIIDLEDGCSLGLVSYAEAKELFAGVIKKSRPKLGKLDTLVSLQEKIGYLRALAIGDLMDECSTLFLEHEHSILTAKFDDSLVDHCTSKSGLKDIIEISVEKIYRARNVIEIEASGHTVLPGLLEEFVFGGISLMKQDATRKYQNLVLLLPEEIRIAIRQNPDDYYHMLRHIVDFVSGLTDRHALSLYRKIKGLGR